MLNALHPRARSPPSPKSSAWIARIDTTTRKAACGPRRIASSSAPPRWPLEPVPGSWKLIIWAAKTKAPRTPIKGTRRSSVPCWTLRLETATVAVSSRRVQQGTDDRRVPLMGVLGAFVFAAQMINFQLPGTGSSGHLGGALLLAILLGPHAAFLVVVSILAIQALLFGDGGLLALGCNAFNMGFFPAFVAYPLVYRPLAPAGATPARRLVGAIAAAEVGLALGAFGVVFETTLSSISDLPFR